jgi:hypothetical protein
VPSRHQWTVKEAACATSAAAFYFEPFAVKEGRSAFHFEDAAQFAANNPACLALEEIRNHPDFKGRDIGCFLSLGSGKAIFDQSSIEAPLQELIKNLARITSSSETAHQSLTKEAGLRALS